MIGVGVVGYGYWGPNLVRNLCDLPEVQLRWICDLQTERLAGVRRRYPSVEITEDFQTLLADRQVDAIAIATPVATHYSLAMQALKAGKHVFVEKPLADSADKAQRLVEEAERRGLILAVDHTFIHTGAVRKMRDIVQSSLGQIYYYDSVRINLGLFQHDVNVIWDLAVHDLAIMDYVLPQKPIAVSATGMGHVEGEPENMAYLTLYFPGRMLAHIHVNWLAPVKVRRTLVGGSDKMIVYDDLEPSEKIKVYDKGITLSSPPARRGEKFRQMQIGYRTGDMSAPQLDMTEALSRELREFVAAIDKGIPPLADGQAGLRIVRMLEAATLSLSRQGAAVELQPERVPA
ncbi:Predicted dehydrogenase [Devosia crocina]|uniref:Predicted dehydrogenase n=1 Tax=Devosia crocina TaxID=429728 RepID=A0A1I7MZ97_9HYPH|nr:Gfo/Idh/MocA family oxidoreductase [Devosia crocina]SFV27743.1 Predicted dehydrogenase [Devosia crocina]